VTFTDFWRYRYLKAEPLQQFGNPVVEAGDCAEAQVAVGLGSPPHLHHHVRSVHSGHFLE